jgi:hypothetical protein
MVTIENNESGSERCNYTKTLKTTEIGKLAAEEAFEQARRIILQETERNNKQKKIEGGP